MTDDGDDPTLEVARKLAALRHDLLDLRAQHRRRDGDVVALQAEIATLQAELVAMRRAEVTPPPLLADDAAVTAALQRWMPRRHRGRPRKNRTEAAGGDTLAPQPARDRDAD